MRKFIGPALAIALGLTALMAVPAAAGNNDRCTKGNVKGFAEGTIALAKQVSQRGATKGTAASWANCQFRLYDNNGPDTHQFSDDEWFLGGIWGWLTDDQLDEFYGGSRKAAKDDFNSGSLNTLEWRRINPAGAWTVLPLTKTSVKAAYSPIFGEVLPVIQHEYHIFKPGSVAPGQYEWRWAFVGPWDPQLVVGRVDIVSG